jgi:hypothetical protein
MTEHSRLLILAVVLVAFIAGYAVVSYVVRKLKEGPFNPELTGQRSKRTNSTEGQSPSAETDETSNQGNREN